MKNTISINNKILEVPYQYLTPYIRNSSYLNFTDPVVTDEKMIGLFAIYETGNYCVITANGAFSINYGDGTATQNYVSGTKAEYNIPYTNIAGNTDVGISTSQACTFTTGTNLVTLTNHNWENLQTISFSTINTTTGISSFKIRTGTASPPSPSYLCNQPTGGFSRQQRLKPPPRDAPNETRAARALWRSSNSTCF